MGDATLPLTLGPTPPAPQQPASPLGLSDPKGRWQQGKGAKGPKKQEAGGRCFSSQDLLAEQEARPGWS